MKKPAIPDIKIYWKAVWIKTVYLYKEERTVKEKKDPRNWCTDIWTIYNKSDSVKTIFISNYFFKDICISNSIEGQK